MNVLAIDIGGTNVKFLARDQTVARKFPSGKTLTPAQMVEKVKDQTRDWPYDRVVIGYPGLVLNGRIAKEPNNLASG